MSETCYEFPNQPAKYLAVTVVNIFGISTVTSGIFATYKYKTSKLPRMLKYGSMGESICLIFHAISLVGYSIVLAICPDENFTFWRVLFLFSLEIFGALSVLVLYTLFCLRLVTSLRGSIFEVKKSFQYCLYIPAATMFVIWLCSVSFNLITEGITGDNGARSSTASVFVSLFYMIYIIMNIILLHYLLKKLYIIVKSALNQSTYISNDKQLTNDDDIKNYMLSILSADSQLLNEEMNNNNDESFKKAVLIAITMIKIFVCVAVAVLSNFLMMVFFALYGVGIFPVYFRPYLTVAACLDALLNNIGLLFQYSFAQSLYKKYFNVCHLCVKKCCLTLAMSRNTTNNNDSTV